MPEWDISKHQLLNFTRLKSSPLGFAPHIQNRRDYQFVSTSPLWFLAWKLLKHRRGKKKLDFYPKFQSKSKLNSWGFSSFPNLAFQKANFFNQRSKISPNFPKKRTHMKSKTPIWWDYKKMWLKKCTRGRITLRDLEPELCGRDLLLDLIIHEI